MFKIKQEDKKITKGIRFPRELVFKIEKQAKKNKVTFSKFVIEACLYALENMDKKE